VTTKTTTTDLKELPERHRIAVPDHPGMKPPPGGKPKKRGLIWVLFLLIIAGVAGYAVWKAGQPNAIPQQGQGGGRGRGGRGFGGGNNGPQPVVTAKVQKANVPVHLQGLGNVTAFYTVTVKSRVDGQLMSVNFKEGDYVKEGQVLAEIDPRPYQVQKELAEGTFARDTALLENAKLDLERYRVLLQQDAVPKQQLDTQTALVAQYQGNIKQDQANIDSAKLNLVYAKVTAPISGRVGLRLVDPGNIVHASDANGMLVITQIDPISTLFTIPEDSLPQVMRKLRGGARLDVDAFNRDNSTKLASGYLLTVDNTIDATTGTSRLKAVFDNKDNALFPNQFVNIRLLVDTLRDQLVVPSVAVQNGQQGTFVYVVDDDSKVHLKPVQVGINENNIAQIKTGLAVGDQVVVDGTDRLQEGMQVRIRQPGEVEAIAASGANAGNRRGGGRGRGNGNGGQNGGGGFKGGNGGQNGGRGFQGANGRGGQN
jgi:membrane fusion protein, multidrug efflux system